MLQLPNKCTCSTLTVCPKNWETGGVTLLKKNWYIQYYFKDPAFTDQYKYGKYVILKGMNKYKDLKTRREVTRSLLDDERSALLYDGYNPITNKKVAPIETDYEIEPTTPFIKALNKAREKINTCMADLKSVIKWVEKAARDLKMDQLPIYSIKRKQIKVLLSYLPKIKDSWSENTFNYYRAHLRMLFKEILEYEAVEYNPIKDLSKKKTTKKIIEILSPEQRKEVDQHLKKLGMTRFRLFLKIFFHSGIREAEMMRLKGKDVNLKTQQVKCLIKKGKQYEEKQKTIKDIAVRYWKLALVNCKPDDYIFSYKLMPARGRKNKPGKLPEYVNILPEYVTRLWLEFVKAPKDKGGLGITSNLYRLKHGHTTEVVDQIGEEAAAEVNSHEGTGMVRSIYDVKQPSRNHDRIRKLKNHF